MINKKDISTMRNKVLKFIVDKNPNGVDINLLKKYVEGINNSDLDIILNNLEQSKIISIRIFENPTDVSRKRKIIELINKDAYPKTDTMIIGDREFPRFLHGDLVGAEDMNEVLIALSEYTKSMETRINDIAQDMTKEFWNKLITIFGVMLSIFALIIKFTTYQSNIASETFSFWNLLLINSAQLIPTSIVLLFLVITLRLFFKNS